VQEDALVLFTLTVRETQRGLGNRRRLEEVLVVKQVKEDTKDAQRGSADRKIGIVHARVTCPRRGFDGSLAFVPRRSRPRASDATYLIEEGGGLRRENVVPMVVGVLEGRAPRNPLFRGGERRMEETVEHIRAKGQGGRLDAGRVRGGFHTGHRLAP